jgi:hypothetical protein
MEGLHMKKVAPCLARPLPALALGLLVLLPGCRSKKELDAAVDGLVESLARGDRELLKDVASPALVEEMDQEKMDHLRTAFKNLGAYRDRTLRSINIQAGVSKTGTYLLTFERGTVNLDIELSGGRVSDFRFYGASMDWALRGAVEESAAVFAVKSFSFIGPDGKPNPGGNAFSAGSQIDFRLAVQGLHEEAGNYHARVHLKVLDHKGGLLAEKQNLIDRTLKVDPSEPPHVTLEGSMGGLPAGTYNLKLTVEDASDGRELDYSQSVLVQ